MSGSGPEEASDWTSRTQIQWSQFTSLGVKGFSNTGGHRTMSKEFSFCMLRTLFVLIIFNTGHQCEIILLIPKTSYF